MPRLSLKKTTGLRTCARVLFAAIWLLSAAYGVIAYVPFTYTQVIESRLSDGLLAFAAHQWIFAWISCAALACSVWIRLRRRERSAWAVLLFTATLAALLTAMPVFGTMQNAPRSLWIGLAMTLPIFALAAADIADGRKWIQWQRPERMDADARLWWAGLAAALITWALFAGVAFARSGHEALVAEVKWSLPAHLTLFAGEFVLLMFASGLALRARRRTPETEFWLCGALAWTAVYLLISHVILRPMAFTGGLSALSSTLIAGAFTTLWMAVSMQIRADSARPTDRGFDLLFNPSGVARPLWATIAILAALLTAGFFAVDRLSAMDWNFLGQEVFAFAIGLIAFAVSYGAIRTTRVGAGWGVVFACAAPIAFAIVVTHSDLAEADRAADRNPSFRLLKSAMVPTMQGSLVKDGLYEYLVANTNLPRDRRVEPLDVRLVDGLSTTNASLPHIFVIVIDSLRRDYIGAFNPAVTFTPRITAFAQEGVAFSNAFTRYGATGLSEPSIWVGGMLLHKQYTEPFAPQNSLAKLITAEEYTPFVSVDTILKVILPPNLPRLAELDRGRATKDYTLCGSLAELTTAVTRAKAPRMFSYTQAQDIHISTIAREGNTVIGSGNYDGFDAPYASRLARIDACFGNFIDALKASGIYDNSIVIFTADHGDSLGEEGRFGHAYTVFPEVMRIPLIVKLPGADQSRIAVNKDALVFSTDITPTLYDLTGHAPTLKAFPIGRTLASGPIARSDGELVGSSYGAVYGWLTQNGRRLYIADSVNFQDYVYDLTKGLVGTRVVADAAERDASRKAIRDGVAAIAKTYHFDPAGR